MVVDVCFRLICCPGRPRAVHLGRQRHSLLTAYNGWRNNRMMCTSAIISGSYSGLQIHVQIDFITFHRFFVWDLFFLSLLLFRLAFVIGDDMVAVYRVIAVNGKTHHLEHGFIRCRACFRVL